MVSAEKRAASVQRVIGVLRSLRIGVGKTPASAGQSDIETHRLQCQTFLHTNRKEAKASLS
jgi:hypothetical protein